MQTGALALIGSSHADTKTLCQPVLDRWPKPDRPPILNLTIDQVVSDESVLNSCAAAWIVLNQRHAVPGLQELESLLQDRHLPTLLSWPGQILPLGDTYKHGIVSGPLQAGPDALWAVLNTLWSQSQVIQVLQTENRLLREHQGGLCGQIDKIDEELRIAAQLQRDFMPSTLPSSGAVEFRVLFRPAGYVSGDVYDVIQLDDRHMGFFMADAVGHGVPAALLTMYIKHSLRTMQMEPHPGSAARIALPDEVLARLNYDMIQQPVGKMRFASACYGLIDCETLCVTFARAGHPFPVIMHPDGSTEFVQPEGSLLGIFPDKAFQTIKIQLHPGDRMLVYSDGFEHACPEYAQPARHDPSEPVCPPALRDLADGPIDLAMQRLAKKLDQAEGSLNQRDDMTVICLSINRDPPDISVPSLSAHNHSIVAA